MVEISYSQNSKSRLEKDKWKVLSGKRKDLSIVARVVEVTDREYKGATEELMHFIGGDMQKKREEEEKSNAGRTKIRKYERSGTGLNFLADTVAEGAIVVSRHKGDQEMDVYYYVTPGNERGNYGAPHVFSIDSVTLSEILRERSVRPGDLTYLNASWRTGEDVKFASENLLTADDSLRTKRVIEVWSKGTPSNERKSQTGTKRHPLFVRSPKPIPVPIPVDN